MSRIRTIKPEFFLDDELAELSALHRLLFVGLWTLADREGRLEDRPKRIRAQILPFDDGDTDAMLADLARAGFVVRYEADGKRYLQVRNFTKHQRITGSEAESKSQIPAPESCATAPPVFRETSRDDSGNTQEILGNIEETPRTTGKERKGKEGKGVIPAPPREKKFGADLSELPEQLADDITALRRAKRAPLTQTAWEALKAEYRKAGLSPEQGARMQCEQGWQGFSAEWLRPKDNAPPSGQGQARREFSSNYGSTPHATHFQPDNSAPGKIRRAIAERDAERARQAAGAGRSGIDFDALDGECHRVAH